MFLMIVSVLLGAIFMVSYIAGGKYFTTKPPSGKKDVFSSNKSNSSSVPTLSIVVPCYNEEERLPPMLADTVTYCEKVVKSSQEGEKPFSDYEIIVVDDCSRDKTKDIAEAFAAKNPHVKIQLVKVNPNRGKGHAVRTGFFHASGDYVLMADGDNATQISDVAKLFRALRKTPSSNNSGNPKIAVGSRAHLEKDSIASRTFFRTVLMVAFHWVVHVTYFICTYGRPCHIKDTQCGFKLFERKPCEKLFLNNRLERWAFDVELLLLARRFGGIDVVEVMVNWQEIPGSKVNFKGMAQMGLECVLMCVVYPFHIWGISA